MTGLRGQQSRVFYIIGPYQSPPIRLGHKVPTPAPSPSEKTKLKVGRAPSQPSWASFSGGTPRTAPSRGFRERRKGGEGRGLVVSVFCRWGLLLKATLLYVGVEIKLLQIVI